MHQPGQGSKIFPIGAKLRFNPLWLLPTPVHILPGVPLLSNDQNDLSLTFLTHSSEMGEKKKTVGVSWSFWHFEEKYLGSTYSTVFNLSHLGTWFAPPNQNSVFVSGTNHPPPHHNLWKRSCHTEHFQFCVIGIWIWGSVFGQGVWL